MKEEFDKLICELSKCDRCKNIKNKNNIDCSLINFYDNQNFYKNIPSIWTDWFNRLNANLMIIGQDWGPYIEMQKFNRMYLKNQTIENWNYIIDEEKSLTKRNLEKFLRLSAKNNNIDLNDNFMNKIYITNAIMCARKGEKYRSNNINLKASTLNCTPYLKRQIDIVKPKIILTLGYYPLLSLSKIYNFEIQNNLTNTINSTPYIKIDNIVIIPLYHPSAQIKTDVQLEQYNLIWKFLKEI